MPLPKLEFGSTGLPGDNAALGTELPDPSTIEFASPERAGIDLSEATTSDSTPRRHEEGSPPSQTTAEEFSSGSDGDQLKLSAESSEPSGEPEEEAAVEPQEAADGFTKELFDQAAQYGYDEASAKRFGSVDNLRFAMADADRRAAQWGISQLQQYQPQPQQFQQQPFQPQSQQLPPQPQQQSPQQFQQQQQFELDEASLRRQGFDDDAIAVFRSLQADYRQQIDAVRAQMSQQITGQSQAEEEARFERDMDAFFDGLGPEWEGEFGAGPMRGLPENSPVWLKRREIASTVFGLQVSDAQLNRGKAPAKDLAQRALNALHFRKQQEIASKAQAAAASTRRSQATSRAGGQTGGRGLSGFDKAVRRAEAFSRKHRLGVT